MPRDMFRVIEPEKFTPNCLAILDPYSFRGQALVKAIQNPTKEDMLDHNYKPRLTIMNRQIDAGRQVQLKIEFSAAKLLFGNNFDELEDKDFPRLLQVLSEKLKEMGVIIAPGNLFKAPVGSIHYSKNVVLNDYTSASMIIDELSKIDLSEKLDLSESKFRNAGHCLHYHANSFEVIFYDKLKDLEQAKGSGKRSIEKENYCQLNILDAIKEKKPFGVFRMEIRLGNRTKMKQLFKKLEVGDSLLFCNLFKKELAKKVLMHYWNEVDKGLSFFSMDAKSPFDLLGSLKKSNPSITPNKLLKIIGAIFLIQEGGTRRLRTVFGWQSGNADSWYALKKELISINNFKQGDKYKSILKVKQALNAFIPLRLTDYDIQS